MDQDIKDIFFNHKEEMLSFLSEHWKNTEDYINVLISNDIFLDAEIDIIGENNDTSRINHVQSSEDEDIFKSQHVLSALEAIIHSTDNFETVYQILLAFPGDSIYNRMVSEYRNILEHFQEEIIER